MDHRGQSPVVLRTRIINPFASAWKPPMASPTWSGTPNLHAPPGTVPFGPLCRF